MTGDTTKRKKTLSVSNASLALMGAERLADLLTGAAKADPALMRALRLGIAADNGTLDMELDKQLARLRTTTGRVNARKATALVRPGTTPFAPSW